MPGTRFASEKARIMHVEWDEENPDRVYDSDLTISAHDRSFLLTDIGDTPTGAIVKQYIKTEPSGKQVFIALDKTKSYGEETDKDLNDHQVLYLSEDGNELFGWSWDHKTGEN